MRRACVNRPRIHADGPIPAGPWANITGRGQGTAVAPLRGIHGPASPIDIGAKRTAGRLLHRQIEPSCWRAEGETAGSVSLDEGGGIIGPAGAGDGGWRSWLPRAH